MRAMSGDPQQQAVMSRLLRNLMAAAQRVAGSCGFILIGIPPDGCPRVVSNLEKVADTYRVLAQLVKDRETPGRTTDGPPPGGDA